MSNISGQYTYEFSKIKPKSDNSSQTGVSSVSLGLKCVFNGQDTQGEKINISKYISADSYFDPYVSVDYLNNNINEICNSFASGKDWFNYLANRISGEINKPVKTSNFVPSGVFAKAPSHLSGIKSWIPDHAQPSF
jgi:hypothetical protein